MTLPVYNVIENGPILTIFSTTKKPTESNIQRRDKMAQPVVHFEITAKDYKAAQEFYGKLFERTSI